MDARERLEVEGEDERQKRLGPGLLHDHLYGDAYMFAGQLLMKVDQTGDNALSTVGSTAIPPINRITGSSPPAPVEPPTNRTSSWLSAPKRR